MRNILLFLILNLTISCTGQIENETDLNNIYDNFFRAIIELNPEIASQLTLSEEMGFDFYNDRLTDYSIEAIEAEYEIYNGYYKQVFALDLSQLSRYEKISAEVFKTYLQRVLEGEKFKYHSYQINPVFGFHYYLINLFTEYHTLNTEWDAIAYITRLELYRTKLDQISTLIALQEEKGILPPEYISEYYLELLNEFIASEVNLNPVYTHFENKIRAIPDLNDNRQKQLLQEVEKNITGSIYPAYMSLIEQINEIATDSDRRAGVWKLPDGNNYYEYLLKKHTTTNMSPMQIHNLGIREVARIQRELSKLFQKLGIEDTLSFSKQNDSYWNLVWENEDFHYQQNDLGREEALRDYQDMITATEKKLPELFGLIPEIPVTVLAVPPYKEKMSGQYYERAPLDGSRPAVFYTNLSWLPFKPGMQTLLHHETIPGHHLQIAIAQESANQHLFNNLTFFTGFLEGWALYAERLAYENGWFEDIYSQIGYLNSELFRAARLVLDTGIHYKKWSREQAMDYMEENLGWSSYGELNRYIVWPGQACAYKIGELKIIELREKAKQELGDEFDLKEFHTVILENGAIPLSLLEEIVNDYILNKKRS
jgi:uncharacterized protein (DUF885 family)